ncbi:IS5 family transposase [Spirochaetia bacterium]|nr:IS5 family transposase [Spirochaetia bacterium]
MKQKGFFDETDVLKSLSELGDPLEKLNKLIEWDLFKGLLKRTLKKEPQGPGGRPPFDYVMMFKILILQKLYAISDDQTEYQITDRLSFRRFLGLALYDTVPDAKTIWLFRENLNQANVFDSLFYRFVNQLEMKGIISHSGSIVDATFVDVPRQRNSREENKQIKAGKTPENWENKPNKKRQKDVDARWMTKNKERHYGYKDHVKVDKKSKIITRFSVTSAEVHDSQELKNLVDKKDKVLYGDSAYTGEKIQACISKRTKNRIHEKGYRNHPLTKTQKRNNTAKSRIRARVEHVFGTMTNSMGGIIVRSIGIIRAEGNIALMNLPYNIKRYAYIMEARSYA